MLPYSGQEGVLPYSGQEGVLPYSGQEGVLPYSAGESGVAVGLSCWVVCDKLQGGQGVLNMACWACAVVTAAAAGGLEWCSGRLLHPGVAWNKLLVPGVVLAGAASA